MAKKTRTVTEGHRKIVLKTGETKRADGMYIYYYKGSDGKRRSISSKTIDGLRLKEAELKVESIKGLRSDKRTITLNEVHEEWQRNKHVNPHTKANYDWLYNSYAKDAIGKERIRKITKGSIREFYSNLRSERHLAVTTIDGLQTVIQQLFLYAIDKEYIDKNPCAGVMKKMKEEERNKRGNREIQAFTKSEQQRFLSFLLEYDKKNKSHWYPLLATMLLTGLRVGELTGLQWDDVIDLDGEHPQLHIMHNLVYYKDDEADKMVWRMNKPKTAAGDRTFFLTGNAADALRMQKEAGLKCKISIDGYDDFVFVNRFGETQHQGTVNRALKRVLTAANLDAMEKNEHGASIPILPSISSHALRKSFITRCAEAKMSLKLCSSIVGHSDYQTTLKIYTKVNSEWAQSEMAELEKYLNS